jgi:hypothetical protein
MDRWKKDARDFGWVMPSAPWWKRLPAVRHVRAFRYALRVREWRRVVTIMGMVPSGYDDWVVYGIAKGMERAR